MLDFCIVSRREGSFDWIPLLADPMVMWVPASHALVQKGSYPVERCAHDPFIEVYPGEDSDNARLLASAEIVPSPRYTVPDTRAAYELVAAGLGVAMMNGLYAREADERVACLPVSPDASVSIGIAHIPEDEASPAVRAFISFAIPRLVEAARKLGD